MKDLQLLVTLSPSMKHFPRFATDNTLAGIRINSAMMYADELDGEIELARAIRNPVPMYFDIKGRQLRIKEVIPSGDHVELKLNHRIRVNLPTPVLFKSGEDPALLVEIRGDDVGQQTLVFAPRQPQYMLKAGESLCIRDPSFKVIGNQFPAYEIERIKKVVNSGVFNRWVLSYVEGQQDIDQLREYVGPTAEIIAKIENPRGLDWVANGYRPQPNLSLMAARGDLYIEVRRPHEILGAMKLIISKDPNALVGSRILLSCGPRAVPDAADFSELAWLYDIGYRRMMLCDDLCLKEDSLARAVNALDNFKQYYAQDKVTPTWLSPEPIRSPLKVISKPQPKKKWYSGWFN